MAVWESTGWPRRPLSGAEYDEVLNSLSKYVESRFPEKFDEATRHAIAAAALTQFMAPRMHAPCFRVCPTRRIC